MRTIYRCGRHTVRHHSTTSATRRQPPLVAVISGRDTQIETQALDGLSTVVHVPTDEWLGIPAPVLRSADAALVWRMSSVADESTLAGFDRLKALIRVGVGVDSIDLNAASRRGIAVCNVPAYGVEEVADTAMAHILALYRRTHMLASGVASGRIDSSLNSVVQREAVGATRMRGQRLGLVGMGRIGTSVALKARAFGFAVSFYDPALPDGVEKALGGVGRFESAAALLEHSDCVSMHCTLNPTSRQLLDAPALQRLPAGALVVNTARGGLIDDGALAAALADGRLGGAAIDCQEAEPHLARSAYVQLLRSRPELNLIVTPHCAFYSDQGVVDMRAMACAEARRALQLDASEWTSAAQAVAAVTSTLRNCVNGHELVASHAEAVWQRWGCIRN